MFGKLNPLIIGFAVFGIVMTGAFAGWVIRAPASASPDGLDKKPRLGIDGRMLTASISGTDCGWAADTTRTCR
jgi:hypothetical protein